MPQALSCVSPATNKAQNCVSQVFKGPRGERKWECVARQGEHNPVGDGNAGELQETLPTQGKDR